MKTKLLLSLPIIGCFAIVSCYQIPDRQRSDKPPEVGKKDTTLTSQEQQKIEEQREKMKKLEEEKEKEKLVEKPKEPTGETPTPDKPAPKPGEYPFANPVPGKEGFVFSPYNNKLVDVRDIPSGTLVRDPTYAAEEKKFFRVP